jgi:polyhydroxybutyrate depolymerase
MNKRTILALVFLAACGSEAAAPSPAPNGGDNPAATDPSTSSGDPGAPGTPADQTPGTPGPTSCSGKAALAGDLDWTVKQNGQTGQDRIVHVHVPAKYDATKPTPVVMNFHGFTSNGKEQAVYTGMNRKADEAGFIAVHGEGIGQQQSWNAGACCGEAMETKIDDVALVSAIIDELESKLCVDAKRVFATGMSNGGFLSHRLACELSNRIAAIAPVAGVLGIPTCTPARPVSVMHFHGTYDALVPYDGIDSADRKFPAVEATVDGWAQRNGCTDTAHTTFESGDAKCTTRNQCTGGTEVTLCAITAGGHTWPGAIPIAAMGHTSQSIRATDAMWEFFQKHPMP